MLRSSAGSPILRLLVVMAATGGLLPLPAQATDPGRNGLPTDSAVHGTFTDHVIVVSIDGLRPDAIEVFGLKTLQRLMREGSYSLTARTIVPSRTLPSHTSMLTGRLPSAHGVLFNHLDEDEGDAQVPTIFELARARGFRTAAFFSKAKFRHIGGDEDFDYRMGPTSSLDKWMATRTVPAALRYLRHERPNLLFIHIGEPDFAGHMGGWMSFLYGMAVKRADGAVGRILEEAERTYGPGNFTLLVTADHGGHDRDHGSEDPRDMTIPWIVYGQGVVPGVAPDGILTTDTGATALWLLGIGLPGSVEGRPIHQAFEGRDGPILADADRS